MSHILKRIAIAGGGKGAKKPKPPTYKPPILGELQYGASYSYAETIDLISDGPIEGLVNNRGQAVGADTEGGIFQGIYLDDTPVAVSSNQTRKVITNEQTLILNRGNIAVLHPGGALDTPVKRCKKFFQALEELGGSNRIWVQEGLYKGVKHLTAAENTIEHTPSNVDGNYIANLATFTQRRSTDNPDFYPILSNDSLWQNKNIWVRAFLKADLGAFNYHYQFWWHGKRGSGLGIPNASGFSYGSGGTSIYHNHKATDANQDAWFWTDGYDNWTLDMTNFMFGIMGNPRGANQDRSNLAYARNYLPSWRVKNSGPDKGDKMFPHGSMFSNTGYYVEEFCNTELSKLISLYTENDNPNGNQYQKTLAKKALDNLWYNFDDPNYRSVEKRLMGDGRSVEDVRKRMFVIIKPETAQAELDFSLVDPDAADGMVPYRSYLRSSDEQTAASWELENLFSPGVDNIGDGRGYIERIDCTCPTIDENGVLTGEMRGFYILRFADSYAGPTTLRKNNKNWATATTCFLYRVRAERLAQIANITYAPEDRSKIVTDRFTENYLFNYTNVLAEAKNGSESAGLLKYFKDIFIDQVYNTDLFGPFTKRDSPDNSEFGTPERLLQKSNMFNKGNVFTDDTTETFNLEIDQGLPLNEGSDDERPILTTDENDEPVTKDRNYSTWGNGSLAAWNEAAISVVHTVNNPNVKSVFITLGINSLKDTAHKETENVKGVNTNMDKDGKLELGSSFPAPLNIQVEVGIVSKLGENRPTNTFKFRIIALIESTTLVDIGNPDVVYDNEKKLMIGVGGENMRSKTNVPFTLPNPEEEGGARYVKITKLSYETNSVLIHKDVTLSKVTEIIPVSLPYPFSAMVATKLDSRAFGAIPERSFDCKLKLVKVPSNYFPAGGVYTYQDDKRYYRHSSRLADSPAGSDLVYHGDWDGSFKSELEWTDNPAWILYDLLTNKRYGLGNHIDEDNINKWELYKIARFCDAVDDNGHFVGVPDGFGGLEPRFSCNIVFEQGEKIYDAISTIADIFRGKVFFSNSDISFVDDRPRTPVNLFTNESVKDGLFHYSNNRRDEQFNTIEVSYRDRFDNFAPKIEVVEDEEDITRRGIFKKTIEGVGITSRAMARRVGQHVIFSNLRENQYVAFNAGLESLLCQPGDLVIIEDELKTNKANFGKILAIDTANETIRVTNTFVEAAMTGRLTVYQPTGQDSISELDIKGELDRTRYETIHLCTDSTKLPTGSPNTDFNTYFSGDYGFSGYTAGYAANDDITDPEGGNITHVEYALYTGTGTNTVYFQTEVTGWMFSTGEDYLSQSGMFIASGTGTQDLSQLDMPVDPEPEDYTYINTYDDSIVDGRGEPSFLASGVFGAEGPTRGALLSEIGAMLPNQTTVLNITGAITSDPNIQGSLLSGVDKPYLLPILKLGSSSKFEIKNASPFIYKVTSLKEENPNEYLISASKYETGKYKLIEDNVSIENESDTFSYQVGTTVNGTTYTNLTTPTITSLTTGLGTTTDTFHISGDWSDPNGANSTGYNVILTSPNFETESVNVEESGVKFDNLATVGIFNMSVNALGEKGAGGGNAYFDSQYMSSGIFVVYEDLLEHPQTFLQGLTILR
jgi:hypothetical protein